MGDSKKNPCRLRNCLICESGDVPYLRYQASPGWGDSVIGAFYCILESDHSKGPWLSLSEDIYPLFESHWNILCPHRKWENQEFWKKHIQDSLSHKKCFISGRDIFGQTGYWRLKESHSEKIGINQNKRGNRSTPTPPVSSKPLPSRKNTTFQQPQLPQQHEQFPNESIPSVYPNSFPYPQNNSPFQNAEFQSHPTLYPPPTFDENQYSTNFSLYSLTQRSLFIEFSKHFTNYVFQNGILPQQGANNVNNNNSNNNNNDMSNVFESNQQGPIIQQLQS